MSDPMRAARARARAGWPIERHALVDDRTDTLPDASPADRVAMVWALTRDAWAIRGEAVPDYVRSVAPGRVVRPGDL